MDIVAIGRFRPSNEELINGRFGVNKFLSRFESLDVKGKECLDIGCGWGALCNSLADMGARSVVGVDLDAERVNVARTRIGHRPCEFYGCDLADVPPRQFDVITSKDSFEHIQDIDGMLSMIRSRFKPGGRAYIGFSPLFRAPFGDHSIRRTLLKPWGVAGQFLALVPWAHIPLQGVLVSMHNRQRSKQIESLRDLSLNCYRFRDFEAMFKRSGLSVVSLKVNVSQSIIVKGLSVLRKIPGLREYCTQSVYVVLQN